MTDVARSRLPNLADIISPAKARAYLTGLFFRLLYWPPAPQRMRRYARTGPYRMIRRLIIITFISGFCFVYGFFYSLFAPALMVYFLVPPTVLALLIVWALPDSRTAPTGPLEWLLYAYFITLIIWPNYLALSLPGMPWITLVRLTGIPLVLTLLVCVSISAKFRSDIGRVLNAAPVSWMTLTAFVAIQALSIVFSADKAGSVQKFIVAQIGWTGVFFASAYIFRRPGQIQRWALILWAMAIFLGVIGIWEYKLHRTPWAGHIPGFLKVEDPDVQRIMNGSTRGWDGVYRVQATFTTSLALSEYMAFTMPFLLHFLSSRYKLWMRLASAASIPFVLYIVYLTNARLGMAGCFVSFLAYGFVAAVRLWRSRKDSLLAPAVLLAYPALIPAAIASTFFVGHLRHAIWGMGMQQYSTDARKDQWNMGIPKIINNPLGHGIGQGGEALGYSPFGFLTIDSYYLMLLLEYGIIGFILYVTCLGGGILNASKTLIANKPLDDDQAFTAPLLITMLNFVVIKAVFAQQDNHSIIYMVMGMIAALASRRNAAEAAEKASGTPSNREPVHRPSARLPARPPPRAIAARVKY